MKSLEICHHQIESVAFILILVLTFSVIPQTGWQWQNPWPTGNHLYDVWVLNDTTIIADGLMGIILRSDDNGESWRELKINDYEFIVGLIFIDNQTGFAIGNGKNNKDLLKTTDGGQNWANYTIPANVDLYDLFFINHNIGWVVGEVGKIYKTTDSGLNWQEQSLNVGWNLFSIFLLDSLNGWIVGEAGIIAKTNNGGDYWDYYYLNSSGDLISIVFTGPDSGWITGTTNNLRGKILSTANGGINWITQFTTSNEDPILYIFALDNQRLWACSDGGNLLKTENGGLNWSITPSDTNFGLNSLYFSNASTGYCVGFNGRIFSTQTGGGSWGKISHSATFEELKAIKMADENTGWSVGTGGVVLKTGDGGRNWTTQSIAQSFDQLRTPPFDQVRAWPYSPSVSSGQKKPRAQSFDKPFGLNSRPGLRARSNDWLKTPPFNYPASSEHSNLRAQPESPAQIDPSITLYSLALINDMNIWIAGNVEDSTFDTHGLMIYSHNGGQTWELIQFPENDGFLDIDFVNDCVGWALAWEYFDRILYKTIDSGQNWTVVWEDTLISQKNKIQFISENTGWLSDFASDSLLKTTDGGSNWTTQVIGFPFGIGDICFIDEQIGWTAGGYEIFGAYPLGGEGYIFNSTDGGNTWTLQKHIMKDMFIGIDFYDNLSGTVVGYNGTVYHTEDGGVNWDAQPTTILWTINDIDFINAEKAWMCGSAGAILYTDTGGMTPIHNPPFVYSIPENIILMQNYPNPFNHSTTIEFVIAQSGKVRVEIFNILGERVNTVLNKYLVPGTYQINWNGSSTTGKVVSSGVYFYKVENVTSVNKALKIKKMVFIK